MNFLKTKILKQFMAAAFFALTAVNLPAQPNLREQAGRLSGEQRFSEAIPLYNSVIENSPGAAVYNDAGYAYYKLGDYASAEAYYLKSIELDSKNPKAFNNLGAVHYARHSWKEAEAAFTKCLEIDPSYAKAMFNLSSVYYRQGNYLKAYTAYQKAKKQFPEEAKERTNAPRPKEDVAYIKRNLSKAPDEIDNFVFEFASNDGKDGPKIFAGILERYSNITAVSGWIKKNAQSDDESIDSVIGFHYKSPDRYRLETIEPGNSVVLTNGSKTWFYSGSTMQTEEIDTGSNTQIDFLPINPFAKLPGNLEITLLPDYDGCKILQMIPRSAEKAELKMLLKVDPELNTVNAVEVFIKGKLVSQTTYGKFKKFGDDIYLPEEIITRLQLNNRYVKETLLLSRLKVNESIRDSMFEAETLGKQ